MIPMKQEHEHYSGKAIETSGFQMASSPKAFKILADGLYSNKILAVIREYCCNAYDSHKDAGKEHLPFSVHIPTKLNLGLRYKILE